MDLSQNATMLKTTGNGRLSPTAVTRTLGVSPSVTLRSKTKRRRYGGGYGCLSLLMDVFLVSMVVALFWINSLNVDLLVEDRVAELATVASQLKSAPKNRAAKTTARRKSPQKSPTTIPTKPERGIAEVFVPPGVQKAREWNKQKDAAQKSKGPVRVEDTDSIYKGAKGTSKEWDSAPIVDKEHKLLLFTVPGVATSTLKLLMLRLAGAMITPRSIMYKKRGFVNREKVDDPKENQLSYLWDYSNEEAQKMMTDPAWTRAIFVEEPKLRFVNTWQSIFHQVTGRRMDLSFEKELTQKCCSECYRCPHDDLETNYERCHYDAWDSRKNEQTIWWLDEKTCCNAFKEFHDKLRSIEGILEIAKTCQGFQWDPMIHRMEPKYWKYINFLGKMETIDEDVKRLLTKVGVEERTSDQDDDFGRHDEASEWEEQTSFAGEFYTPETERFVEDFYRDDYDQFNYPITQLANPAAKILKEDEWIYQKIDWDWDTSPIVVRKHKLVFFTIPNVANGVWKKAFRRTEGYADWNADNPYDPGKNGLTYLYDFTLEEANEIMTSKEWTKAIFVRNPKDRFLAGLDQVKANNQWIAKHCCPQDIIINEKRPIFNNKAGCLQTLGSEKSIRHFLEWVAKPCYNSYWSPYADRFDPKWWKYMDFVGHLETAKEDAERLLRRIGAWEAIGEDGWGDRDAEVKTPIFGSTHALPKLYKTLDFYDFLVDEMLDEYFQKDYDNPVLNLTDKMVHAVAQSRTTEIIAAPKYDAKADYKRIQKAEEFARKAELKRIASALERKKAEKKH